MPASGCPRRGPVADVAARSARAALAALLLASCVLVACGNGNSPRLNHLVIATGPEGSVYHALGLALATVAKDRWGVNARAENTAASVENLRLLADGRADAAFTTVDVAASAVQGDAPFFSALPIVALAGLYEDYLHVVVRADSRVQRISDLRGLRVSTGPVGAGTGVVAARVLEAAGLNIYLI